MAQSTYPRNPARNSKETSKRALRKKKARKRLIILLAITFFLGFLLGLLIGSKGIQPLNIMLAPQASEENAKKYENLPWYLTLVNFENAISKDFEPEELAEVNNGYMADSRIADAAKEMIAAAAQEGVHIITISAYRDYEYQQELYNNKVSRLQNEEGYSISKAREEAATVVAYPGTSEHQLGLALDLVDSGHVDLDESQETTDAYKWLKKHCQEYGFIVRYPNGKTDITGIIYEPWHFRYVGEEAAKTIMEKGICLEEYLENYYQ